MEGVADPRPRSIDDLRAALMVLVVAHHAAQPYTLMAGRWYVSGGRLPPLFLSHRSIPQEKRRSIVVRPLQAGVSIAKSNS